MFSGYIHESDWLTYELPADYEDHLDDYEYFERDLLRDKRRKEKNYNFTALDSDSLDDTDSSEADSFNFEDFSDDDDDLDDEDSFSSNFFTDSESEEIDFDEQKKLLAKLILHDNSLLKSWNEMTKGEEKEIIDQAKSDISDFETYLENENESEDFSDQSFEDFDFETKDPSSVKALSVGMGKSENLNQLLPKLEKFDNLKTFSVMVELDYMPLQICKLKSLVRLTLEHSGIREIPPEICELQQLRDLDLNTNKIRILPPELFKLTNLTTLEVSYNKLTVIPDEINLLSKLMHLDISHNRLIWIPAAIRKLIFLSWFNFSGNKLMSPIPKQLTDLYDSEQIEQFWIHHNLSIEGFVAFWEEKDKKSDSGIAKGFFDSANKGKNRKSSTKENHPKVCVNGGIKKGFFDQDTKTNNNHKNEVSVPKKKPSKSIVKKRKQKKTRAQKKKEDNKM